MSKTKLYDYTILAPKNLIKELKKMRQEKDLHINWFNFSLDEIFYVDNGRNYRVVSIDKDKKIICFEHI